jgi:hypothetical protein
MGRSGVEDANMGIQHHIEDHSAFDPDQINLMAKAFEDVCNTLSVFAGDDAGRRVIAMRIIDLARNGVIDAAALRDRVINEAKASF